MSDKYVIAIDGPAASGKSTTAKKLAQILNYTYIDTGAMYRACALYSVQKNIDIHNDKQLEDMLSKIKIDIQYTDDANKIILNGEDVTKRIREIDITKRSSEIAVLGRVRERMVELQREMGKKGGIVMDGRDIGTVVFPDADFKFFMTADAETRALRRWKEMDDKDKQNTTYDKIVQELVWRDKNDSTRTHSPLKKAEDAIEIDTTDLTITEQVETILYYITPPKKNAVYSIIIYLIRVYMKLIWNYRIHNKHRVKFARNCIIASNHISANDPPFIGSILPYEIHYVAKAELTTNPIIKILLKYINLVPIKRGKFDRNALNIIKRILHKGDSILIFPEGTRKESSVKAGVGKLAVETTKDILPIYIHNSNQLWKCLTRKKRLEFFIGKRIETKKYVEGEFEDKKQMYRSLANYTVKKIYELRDESKDS